jgi:hypothetical protein
MRFYDLAIAKLPSADLPLDRIDHPILRKANASFPTADARGERGQRPQWRAEAKATGAHRATTGTHVARLLPTEQDDRRLALEGQTAVARLPGRRPPPCAPGGPLR